MNTCVTCGAEVERVGFTGECQPCTVARINRITGRNVSIVCVECGATGAINSNWLCPACQELADEPQNEDGWLESAYEDSVSGYEIEPMYDADF